jgi:hypothetical protein
MLPICRLHQKQTNKQYKGFIYLKVCVKHFFVITVLTLITLQYNVTDIFILNNLRFNGLSIKLRVYCINFSIRLNRIIFW